MTDRYVLVCDLGGTRLRVAFSSLEAEIQSKKIIATPTRDPEALVKTMRDVLSQTGVEVMGAVVGVPGPVD